MKTTTIRAARSAALAIALVACSADRLTAPTATIAGESANLAITLPSVRISEFHYDNGSVPDQGERIEISGPAGTNLAGWQIVRYNGANPTAGVVYTSPGNPAITGTIPNQCGGRGTLFFSYPQDGLQNGPNDGFALVNPSNVVIEFLSTEGTVKAAAGAGPAAGMTSIDIGIAQTGDATFDPVGASLQRDDNGIWGRRKVNSFGACNTANVVTSFTLSPANPIVQVGGTLKLTTVAVDDQTPAQVLGSVPYTFTSSNPDVATVDNAGVVTGVAFGTTTITATSQVGTPVPQTSTVTVSAPAGSAANVRVSEFHYDNDGSDSDEKIELEGDFGGSLEGWSIVLYNGSNPTVVTYGTPIALSGSFGNACTNGTRGVLTFDATGLQNGDKDGFALVNASGQVVEFLSYEGSFTASSGPANGMTSTDVGVSEANAPAAGRSLQRAGNGTWFGPFTSSFGACNAAVPPPPITGITFSGRLPSDPAVPVGYQDQLFATLRDENTGAAVPTTFTWVSESPTIATIDQRGEFTGLAAGNATFRATAANGVTRTITFPIEDAPLGDQTLYRNPLAFGTPTDNSPLDELVVTRPQYTVSYNQAMGRPNWAAYHLSKTVRGDLPGYRCDCFTADPNVSTTEYPGISGADYTGSGFDRGHMVRSNDRELARGEQATTYYMTNIVPQYAALNQHRWAAFESYLQTVADGPGTPEVYIVTGPRGNAGTIAGGRVAIPVATWKVAVVLPAGMTPAQVHAKTDIIALIAVDMPNTSSLTQDDNWDLHKTTVDAIESASGYDLLSALPDPLEAILESEDHEPTATITAPASANEGSAVTFDGTTSSDPDLGDVLTYDWTFSNGAHSTSPTPSVVFADNGVYSATLTVTDTYGATSTTSKNITIANVSPTVGAFAGATILRGETYTSNGAFTDPGSADTFGATVNYGDGGGATGLALGTGSFTLSHAYANAGTFTVSVVVTDDDNGTGSRTATVTVLSAADAIAVLAGQVSALEASGALTKGEANALNASLDAALKSLEKGNTTPAANQLGAFINKVEAMRSSGRISAATAQALIDYANRTIASIG